VLHWLKMSVHVFNTFVANRVVEIQELINQNEWRHVRSEDNPAVLRGQLLYTFSRNRMWFTGPIWLSKSEDEWPDSFMRINEVPELRKNVCLLVSDEYEIIGRFSSYSKLLRVVAYCRRWLPTNAYTGLLSVKEVVEAEKRY